MSDNSAVVAACHLAFEGYEKNDKTKLLELLAEDVVFDFPQSLPYGGTYKGIAGFKAFWDDVYENYYEYFNYDALAVLDAGTHVIVPVVARAKAKNGRTMENQHCFLFEVRDGKIAFGRIYADTAKGRDILEGMPHHSSRATG